MSSAFITILRAGPLSLLQDLGRAGVQQFGFCQSGAADEHAFRWAQKLLCNDQNSAAIEITLGPFECEFSKATRVAITGAKATITLNQTPINSWQSFNVAAGDRLLIQRASSGLRIYLAIAKGFKVPRFLNSCSSAPRESTGVFGGKTLQTKQRIEYQQEPVPSKNQRRQLTTPARFIPDYDTPLNLRLIPGYQYSDLAKENREAFFRKPFTISADSDRMGYRLKVADKQEEASSAECPRLLSEGIALGAVQLLPDNQAIIMLKDRQTIGGYPKLGCVAQLDCYQLSQRRPGQTVRFIDSDVASNQRELARYYHFFSRKV